MKIINRKKPSIFFIYKTWIVGGYEYLCEKLCIQFQKKGYKASVICESMDEVLENEFRLQGIEIYYVKNWWRQKEFKDIIGRTPAYIIASSINEYLKGRLLIRRPIKTLFYMTIDTALNVLEGDLFCGCNYLLTKKWLDCEVKKRHICAMNKHCHDTVLQSYGNDEWLRYIDFIRIGVEIEKVDYNKIKDRVENRKELRILTAARAAFPDKGYLLGLLDFFEKKDFSYEVKVIIITYGPFEKEIKNKLDGLKLSENVTIHMIGKTEKKELKRFFDQSNLYIGMGTSIIDAAQEGVLCIPIKPYTYEISGSGFFGVDNHELGNLIEKNVFGELVSKAMEMTDEEYLAKCLDGRKAAEEIYDIRVTAKKLFNRFNIIDYNKFSIKTLVLYSFRKMVHSVKKMRK